MAPGAKLTSLAWALARVILAGLFLWAGTAKALDPAEFAAAIDRFRLLPHPAAAALAVYLPGLEILAALAILIPRLRPGGLAVVGGLSVVFAGALASAWIRGLDLTCGCFGAADNGTPLSWSLLRALVLAVVAAAALGREVSCPRGRT